MFDSGTWFFLENSSQLGVFWPRRGLQADQGTVRKSAIFPQPSNQKQLKWNNTAYVNKWSFAFKIKLCVTQVTETKFCMKIIRIFNAQPVPHFKSLLTRKRARWPYFLMFNPQSAERSSRATLSLSYVKWFSSLIEGSWNSRGEFKKKQKL